MGLRQRKWARKTRLKLRKLLGEKCAYCGTKRELQFDVICPFDNGKHHKIEWSWRMSFYRKEYDKNNLQLLCESCNKSKKDNLELNSKLQHDQPF